MGCSADACGIVVCLTLLGMLALYLPLPCHHEPVQDPHHVGVLVTVIDRELSATQVAGGQVAVRNKNGLRHMQLQLDAKYRKLGGSKASEIKTLIPA